MTGPLQLGRRWPSPTTRRSRFACYSLSPVDTGAATIDRTAQYLHRANHGLLSGTFELDYDTGELRLRTGLEFATLPPGVLTDNHLLDSIMLDLSAANVGIFDEYLASLVTIVHGTGADADIIADIEGSIDATD